MTNVCTMFGAMTIASLGVFISAYYYGLRLEERRDDRRAVIAYRVGRAACGVSLVTSCLLGATLG